MLRSCQVRTVPLAVRQCSTHVVYGAIPWSLITQCPDLFICRLIDNCNVTGIVFFGWIISRNCISRHNFLSKLLVHLYGAIHRVTLQLHSSSIIHFIHSILIYEKTVWSVSIKFKCNYHFLSQFLKILSSRRVWSKICFDCNLLNFCTFQLG